MNVRFKSFNHNSLMDMSLDDMVNRWIELAGAKVVYVSPPYVVTGSLADGRRGIITAVSLLYEHEEQHEQKGPVVATTTIPMGALEEQIKQALPDALGRLGGRIPTVDVKVDAGSFKPSDYSGNNHPFEGPT